ncbi:MAG: CAP domain-containing protein [Solirubrobacterales bacterium]
MLLTAFAPGRAEAASCSGGDKHPRQISSKTAAKVVVCLVNKKRRHHGMRPLKKSSDLMNAARGHTRKMQKTNCFSHNCPGERSLSGRYERARYLPCGCSWGAGENIGWGPGRKGSPRQIVKAWMHSPEHRRNILGSFDHVGVGVKWGSPSRRHSKAGTYTMDFGYKR